MQFVIVEAGSPSLIGKVCGFVTDDNLVYELLKIAEKNFKHVQYLSSTFLIALSSEDEVIGGCGISIENGLHIDVLCVNPILFNRGIGTAIIEKAMQIGHLLNEKHAEWIESVIPYGNDVFPDDEKRQLTLEFKKDSKNYQFYVKNKFEIYSIPGVTTLYCRRIIC